ncbi:CHC2 zinc finger domain-containing protein [Sphingomonas aquatilis]
MSDDQFRDMVREAKESYDIVDVIGRKTRLKKSGREHVGLCIEHDEKTPSLNVNQTLQVYFCRGCGATGDIIRAWQVIEGCSFIEAVRGLLGGTLPKIDPAQRVQAVVRDEAERSQRIEEAVHIWKQTTALAGTAGETYLRGRGINDWPHTLRFANTWWWCNHETGETSPDLPAVIGLVQRHDGDSGIQRIFLRPDGSGKAAIAGGKAKLSLGGIVGGALRLGPAAPEILLCEGPEDGLSLRQELRGASVWVALGTANMPKIRFPDTTRRIVICAQNDAAGDRATDIAADALLEQGYMVDVRHPAEQFKDWNDQLVAVQREQRLGYISPDQARRYSVGAVAGAGVAA